MAPFDPLAFKKDERERWRRRAPQWVAREEQSRRWGAAVSERLLALAELAPGQRVLDLATGTGDPALAAAQRVAPGQVVGVDLTTAMVHNARSKVLVQGTANAHFMVMDAEALAFAAGSFDAVLCRYGLMFLPDGAGALRQVRRILKPGGRLAACVWGPPERNLFFSLPVAIVNRHVAVPRPEQPNPFSLASPEKLAGLLRAAGFADVEVEVYSHALIVPGVGEYLSARLAEPDMPEVQALDGLGKEQRQAVLDEVAAAALRYMVDEELYFPAETLYVRARKGEAPTSVGGGSGIRES